MAGRISERTPGHVSPTRAALGALGFVVGLYGAYLLLSRQDVDQLVSAAIWLGGGVIAHDGLIAILGLTLLAVGGRLLPAVARPPAAVGMVVLGSLTILAIPMLGSFGAKADNPTLLDRNYWLGWTAIAVLVVVAVVVATVIRARRGVPGASAVQDGRDGPA